MWRVEPICEVLTKHYGIKISASGYYALKNRPVSAREKRDSELKAKINDIWKENYCCWGVVKVWRALLNDGETVARCTVGRLMKEEAAYSLSRIKRNVSGILSRENGIESFFGRLLASNRLFASQ